MTLCVTVELLNGTFRGRGGDQSRTTWPPSPVRLLGALLRGAHSLAGADGLAPSGRCALARQALSQLAAAPPPLIVAPAPPVELGGVTSWFAARDVGDQSAGLKKLVAQPAPVSSSNLVQKPRTVSLLPLGNEIRFYISAEIADEGLWQALVAAARAVPFLGSSTDHAQFTVDRVDSVPGQALGEHLWRPVLAPATSRGVKLRTWTPETVAWFDANHTRSGAPIADWRVTTTTYTSRPAQDDPLSSGGFYMLTLPAPITLRDYARRVAAVPGWSGAAVLPAVEFNAPDRVRGFGLYGPGLDGCLAASPEELLEGGDCPGSFTSWNPATWVGPSGRWQSATAAAGHRDPRVARRQLDTDLRSHGLRLTALSRSPLTWWHSRKLSVPSNYGLWFVTAELVDLDGDLVSGPIRIGECLSSGAGLLTPSRK